MRYHLLYADPPWKFTHWRESPNQNRSASNHYGVMSFADLKALPVQAISEADSVLLLWAVWPSLPDCIEVAEAWGFTYVTCAFNWFKITRNGRWASGLGYYTRANSEPCLLFKRGNGLRRLDRNVLQVLGDPTLPDQLELFPEAPEAILYHNTRHSAKPRAVYGRINELFGPVVTKIELFGRPPVQPGWTALGYEIDGLDIHEALQREIERPSPDTLPTLAATKREKDAHSYPRLLDEFLGTSCQETSRT